MAKQKWQVEEVIGKHRCYARETRSEIIVRIENDGDTFKYTEWYMPQMLGLDSAMRQAEVQTVDDQIME